MTRAIAFMMLVFWFVGFGVSDVREYLWSQDGWPVVGEPLSKTNLMTTEKAVVNAGDIVGSWRLSQDYGPEQIVDLLGAGRIANRRNAKWELSGNQIILSWPSRPGSRDRCFIEPAKDSFIGRDEAGVVIRGKKLSQ